jgi:hypothetical protein
MQPVHDWWRAEPDEVFWLEIIDREFLGSDLNAPQRKDDGGEFWGYSLMRETVFRESLAASLRPGHDLGAMTRGTERFGV